jgi:hypothetical protein
MSKQTHTPWIVDPGTDVPLGVIENTEDGMGVCTMDNGSKADARLIAAAPEMYQLLDKLHFQLAGVFPHSIPPQLREIAELLARIDGE